MLYFSRWNGNIFWADAILVFSHWVPTLKGRISHPAIPSSGGGQDLAVQIQSGIEVLGDSWKIYTQKVSEEYISAYLCLHVYMFWVCFFFVLFYNKMYWLTGSILLKRKAWVKPANYSLPKFTQKCLCNWIWPALARYLIFYNWIG